MRLPSELVRALYDVPAFRGSRTPGATARGKWWTNLPEEAATYTSYDTPKPSAAGLQKHYPEGANTIPGQLNTRDFVSFDLGGSAYNQVPGNTITDTRVRAALEQQGFNRDTIDRSMMTVDQIAVAAEQAGYPGAIFRNMHDQSGELHTQYYVADPRRRRSRFAKFQDPNSEDLMAGLVMSLMGAGAGGAALTQQNREQT